MISLGTIINYVNQRIAIEKFWRKVLPGMKEKDVKRILNTLLELDNIEELQDRYSKLDAARKKEFDKILEDLNNRINETVHRYTKSVRILSNSLLSVAQIAEDNKYTKITDMLDNSMDYVEESYNLLNTLDEVWPGMAEKIEGTDENAENTQV